MADGIVLDATAAGQLITYVAPGYLAYIGYRLRYPGPSRPLGRGPRHLRGRESAARGPRRRAAHQPSAADSRLRRHPAGRRAHHRLLRRRLRGSQPAKDFLSWLGHRTQPETSIYAQTLYRMSEEATVLSSSRTVVVSLAVRATGRRPRTTASTSSTSSIPRRPTRMASPSPSPRPPASSSRCRRSRTSCCPRTRQAPPLAAAATGAPTVAAPDTPAA
jgi:hypothetical protein